MPSRGTSPRARHCGVRESNCGVRAGDQVGARERLLSFARPTADLRGLIVDASLPPQLENRRYAPGPLEAHRDRRSSRTGVTGRNGRDANCVTTIMARTSANLDSTIEQIG